MSARPITNESHLAAGQTGELAAVLALKPLHDDRVVAAEIDVPLLGARLGLRHRLERELSLGRHRDRRRLVKDKVEVLVQAVEEEGEELLRVVLIRAAKLGRKVADGFLAAVSQRTAKADAP